MPDKTQSTSIMHKHRRVTMTMEKKKKSTEKKVDEIKTEIVVLTTFT